MSVRTLFRLVMALSAITIATAVTSRPIEESAQRQVETQSPYSPTTHLPVLSEDYLEAAEAIRQDDFATAERLLAPVVSSRAPGAQTASLVLGIYANRADLPREALQRLESTTAGTGHLEDWRLYALADSARALENYPTAERALSQLLSEHRDSPIRAFAMLLGTEIGKESKDWEAAQSWIDRSRREGVTPKQAEQIERVAWEIGKESQNLGFQQAAARQLLTDHPKTARELEIVEDLSRVLTTAELKTRAKSLLVADLAEEALQSLELVGESERDQNWRLLHAEALTEDHQGLQAHRELESWTSSQTELAAEIAWQRARAALDASVARRGRANLSQSERLQMRQLALQQLRDIVALELDQESSRRALRLLFTKLSNDDEFDDALATLVRLLQIDPSDTTGRRYLWKLGWKAYMERDYPVAVGYWSELESMYPDTSSARSGRYWTARAHEALGHTSRATDIYKEIVGADTKDFYSRHAEARLTTQTDQGTFETMRPTEPWPEDALLDRALWLSDLGLDEFALMELEALEDRADQRARLAAKAIVLARHGQRRDSIRSLARAFPALGKSNQAIVPDDALRLYYPLDFREIIERYAKERGLSPYLVFAMVRQESAFDINAKSWAGARGLMQLMPATGKELAQRMGLRYSTERLNDPEFSVRLGTSYYRQVLEMFDGNHELALAGYNGGPYRIKKLWRQAGTNPELDQFLENLRLEETKTYVKRILLFENTYKRLYSEPS